eukprot:gnl/MRDRNA2_/MRDRNA2_118065_c0_seq1.p1 gnl/MRDRNA2_/MRDRNA2_118065_c0~~gnl/MRDRNA2_/MRDRNA2_118065_c0_seq1.p1  ORF type:complete len:396 (+),score=59.21 gnl/MRDRNA2_/MRDRNA2_118065_c0_seq1:48-1190(+)
MTEPLIGENDVYRNGVLQKHTWRFQASVPKEKSTIGAVLKHKRPPWPLHQDDKIKPISVNNPRPTVKDKTYVGQKHLRLEWPVREEDGTLGLRTLTENQQSMSVGGQSQKADTLSSDMQALNQKVADHVSSLFGDKKIAPKLQAAIQKYGEAFESNNPRSAMTEKGRLTSFAGPGIEGRGLAEQARWLLAATGVQWEEAVYQKNRQGLSSLYRKLPMVEIDGLQLVQSEAIVQYVAKRGGISGQNPEEESLIDTICQAIQCARGPLVHFAVLPSREKPGLQASLKSHMAKHFCHFQVMLEDKPHKGFVKSGLSVADVLLAELVEGMLRMDARVVDASLLQFYPRVRMLHKYVVELPSIAAYLSSRGDRVSMSLSRGDRAG